MVAQNTAARMTINPARLSDDTDLRTGIGRRSRDLMLQFLEGMGGEMTAAQLALVRRSVALIIAIEMEESALSRGERVDLKALSHASGALRRLLAGLPLKKTITLGAFDEAAL